jgi:hypothetical protein
MSFKEKELKFPHETNVFKILFACNFFIWILIEVFPPTKL